MLTYWDAYYWELALEREAARERAADPIHPPGAYSARHLAIWLSCVALVSSAIAVVTAIIG